MTAASIYQIYYSDQTRTELDPGFLPLDNSANPRPDWREYWPIRAFLLGQTLEPDRYYGFFSPKFKQKTTLTATMVQEFIRQRDGTADVISFSPFFDQMALPLNILELAAVVHDCRDTFAQCAALVAPGFCIESSVMSSLDIVYCNYFVAKPRFWTEWLSKCEQIFAIAEQGITPLGQALNRVVSYGTGAAPAKVFLIERVASLLLWSDPHWRHQSFNPQFLPHLRTRLSAVASAPDLLVLDALKIAYARSGVEQYLAVYHQLRERLSQRHAASQPSTRPTGAIDSRQFQAQPVPDAQSR